MSKQERAFREPETKPAPPTPEVINLEIDENDDFGGDPYNRTGSHCVLTIGDDD